MKAAAVDAERQSLRPWFPSRHEELPLSAIDAYPDLMALLRIWEAGCGGFLPAAIDPLVVPRALLPYVMLLELETLDGTPRLRVRLAGTEVCAKHGGEMRGKTTDDFFAPADARAVVDSTLEVARTLRPSLARRDYISLDDRLWGYVRLILPMSPDGVNVTRFFKVLDPGSLRERR
jgi:hypothetical protein